MPFTATPAQQWDAQAMHARDHNALYYSLDDRLLYGHTRIEGTSLHFGIEVLVPSMTEDWEPIECYYPVKLRFGFRVTAQMWIDKVAPDCPGFHFRIIPIQ